MYKDKPGLHARQKKHVPGNLRTIALDVTNRCNMECAHCYAHTFRTCDSIELDVLQRVFDEAYDMGVFHYVLQGGEAILEFERLKQIISMIRPKETYINVVSNGWEMDLPTIRALKELDVDKIAFSLDSGIPEEHDKNRREGAFAKVIEAVKNVQSEGLFTSISTVVARGTLGTESFTRVLEIAAELGVRVDMQVAIPVGKWDGKKDIRVTPEEAAKLQAMHREKGRHPDGQPVLTRDLYDANGDQCCPAGRDFMAITAGGDILPCNFCQYSLGNIREVSLERARKALMQSEWFQGTYPRCLVGEDDVFFEKYIEPFVDEKKPINAYTLFDLEY